MMKNMRRGIPNLFKEGTRHRVGPEALLRNLEATKQLADLTRSSMGPNGMNKMLINHLDKIFVTSDTCTLLNEMEIAHPAAKMLVMAAQMQETEVGDGSNLVIALGGELLGLAEELLQMGLHTADIISGYTKGGRKCLELVDSLVVDKIEGKAVFDKDQLVRAILAPMASKQYGYERFLAPLVAEACLSVMPQNSFNFAVDNVRVVKLLGGSIQQSEVIRGLVIPQDTLTSVKKLADVKVAVFTCSLAAADTETKGTVLIHNADELMNFNKSEEREIERLIKGIHEAGVRLVVTGSTVDDMALHFLEKYQIMVLKITSKFELRRICKATQSRALVALQSPRPEEIGFIQSVYVREVGLTKITVLEQGAADHSNVATVLLRASTHNHLNDIERAIDDGVNTVRALTRDGRLVAGAGAFEIELARQLQQFASTQTGLEQYALAKFASSLEVIPRALAENAGHNAMETISALYAAHEKGQSTAGVDITSGTVCNAVDRSIFDLLALKKQAIKLTLDAVLTVLRVDQIIQAKQAGGPKMPKQNNWDED